MNAPSTELPTVSLARMAGALYLIIICTGIFSEVFVRGSVVVIDDAATTASNILSSPGWYRIGFAADAVMLLSDVAIALVFYALLRPVNRNLALAAAAFRLIQAAILGGNLLNYYAPLLLLTGTGVGEALAPGHSNKLALFFLQMHSHGYDIGLIFFAFSTLILGHLVVRSGFLPAVLGYGLWAAAGVYLIGSFTRFLAPEYLEAFQIAYVVPLVAQLSFCLWLLIKGIKTASP